MEIVGELTVLWSEASETVTWTWAQRGETWKFSREKVLISQDFERISTEFQSAWNQCYSDIKSGAYSTARSQFERVRGNIQIQLTPSGFKLDDLPKGIIVVSVKPDTIPIELFNVDGEPFCIRNLLIHRKQLDKRLSRQILHEQESVDLKEYSPPCCYMAIMKDCPHPDRSGHWISVHSCLQSLYCQDQVFHREDLAESGGMQIDEILDALSRSGLGTFYYFGHGNLGPIGSLKLDNGPLDAETLNNRFLEHSPVDAGLAFLNACWTAGLHNNGLDLARIFCQHGWQAVIGTVGPPLGSQAVRFAEEFFSQLCQSINIARAFHNSQIQAWQRYKESSEDNAVPDMTWAVYRLYASEEHLCLNTIFTRKDRLVEPWSGFPLGSLKIDETMEGVIARLLSQLTEIPEPRKLIKIAMEISGGEKVACAIICAGIASPDSDIAQKLFKKSTRYIFKNAIRNVQYQVPSVMSEVDILNALIHPSTSDIEFVPESPKVDVSNSVASRLLRASQVHSIDFPLTSNDIVQGLSGKTITPVHYLFKPGTGELKWDALSGSAQCIIIEAVKAAKMSGRPMKIEVDHLAKGLIGFCLKVMPRNVKHGDETTLWEEWISKIAQIKQHHRYDKVTLFRWDFSHSSLEVLADCMCQGPMKNRGEEGDDFWYVLLDSLYWLVHNKMIEIDSNELSGDWLHVIEDGREFHESRSVIPRIMRDIIDVPRRSPGLPEETTGLIHNTLTETVRALGETVSDPMKIPIIPHTSALFIELLLTEVKRRSENERLHVIVLPWKRFREQWPVLVQREKYWRRLFNRKGRVMITAPAIARQLSCRKAPVLLCISDIDSLANGREWNIFNSFIREMRKPACDPRIPIVLTANENLLHQREQLKTGSFTRVPFVHLNDKSVRQLLHHHVQFWWGEILQEFPESLLHELRECVGVDLNNTDLFSEAGEFLYSSVRQLPSVSSGEADFWRIIRDRVRRWRHDIHTKV